MRNAVASVAMQRGGHFRDAPADERRLYDELAGELHSRGAEVERTNGSAIESAQSAMEIAHPGAKEKASDEAEHRIAEVAVQRGHRPPPDAALEPVAHHQQVALAQLVHERVEVAEVVAVIGIAHDDEPAACHRDAGSERRTVTALGHCYDAGARGPREPGRLVRGAVVGNQNFSFDAGTLQESPCLLYAPGNRGRLVEARHENGEFRDTAPPCAPSSLKKKGTPKGTFS